MAQGRQRQLMKGHGGRHRIARQAEYGHVADSAEGERFGWLDGHLHPAHFTDAIEHGLDVVVVAHAHSAGGDQGIALRHPVEYRGLDEVLVVGDQSQVDRHRIALRQQG